MVIFLVVGLLFLLHTVAVALALFFSDSEN